METAAATSPAGGMLPEPAPGADAGDVLTPAALTAMALERAGFPAQVVIGREAPAGPPSGRPPRFRVRLTAVAPVSELVAALRMIASDRRQQGLMLVARVAVPYRERLHLREGNVASIRRHFVRRAAYRGQLAGLIWRAEGPLAPLAPLGPAWRIARALRRRTMLTTCLLATDPFAAAQGSYFVGPSLRPRPGFDRAKRLFDIAFSLFALTVTLPVTLPAALLIKLYDRGPIFFSHRREGLNGRPFGCLKFRTMVRNAEALKKQLRAENQVDGPQFKLKHDPRITPLGRFLRKSNIDELPQFLNVLAGRMSVVGPRPSPFEENQLCPAWREARLSVKPGITGLWQVSRSRQRGAADFQEWIYYDTQYVERRSFSLDARIILLTLKELFGSGQ